MQQTLAAKLILVGLEQLFNPNKYFDICKVQALAKLAGARLTPEQDAMFAIVHCVDYRNMPEGMREQLAEEVVQMLQQTMPTLDFSVRRPVVTAVAVVTTETPAPQPRGLRRLLGL